MPKTIAMRQGLFSFGMQNAQLAGLIARSVQKGKWLVRWLFIIVLIVGASKLAAQPADSAPAVPNELTLRAT